MRCHREHLAGAEVLVFGPNVFDLDRLDPWRQRRLFRRRKELLDARAKSAETPSPGNRQAAVNLDGTLAQNLLLARPELLPRKLGRLAEIGEGPRPCGPARRLRALVIA